MGWVTIGVVVVVLFLLFFSLFAWYSGALAIADEEKEDIEKESPEEIQKQLAEVEKQDNEDFVTEQDEFHSHG